MERGFVFGCHLKHIKDLMFYTLAGRAENMVISPSGAVNDVSERSFKSPCAQHTC